jgi:phosphate transport system ATP-binding protein
MTLAPTTPTPAPSTPAPASAGPDAGSSAVNVMETQDLRVGFGPREVLHGVSLPFVRGQVTAMVGPSGCGKTTLLRTLNRLTDLTPNCHVTGGTVTIDGEDCMAMDPILLRRRVGMVFQKPNPFPMSIRENVLFGHKAQGRHKAHHDEILESSLRRAVLWDEVKDRLNDSALTLSGGQQQRVCIARALATSPEVVLMDEPASALDPRSTALLEESIAELRGDYTIVIVTHHVAQAQRVSDHLAFLFAGHVVEYGETARLFAYPREAATRAYLEGANVTDDDSGEEG